MSKDSLIVTPAELPPPERIELLGDDFASEWGELQALAERLDWEANMAAATGGDASLLRLEAAAIREEARSL